jgi:hypothetical protein
MRIPQTWIERLTVLEQLENQPVRLVVVVVACTFYGLFLLQAASGNGPLLMIDLVFVPIHEGGHLLFSMVRRVFGSGRRHTSAIGRSPDAGQVFSISETGAANCSLSLLFL